MDFARTDPADYQRYDQTRWLLLLILTNVFGAMLWLLAGRPQRQSLRP